MKNSGCRFISAALRMFLTCCGATLLLWPAASASAQAGPGPLPSHPPADSEPAPAPVQASAQPRLAGTWKRNKDQSDDPRKAMQQSGGHSGGGYGGYGGPGGGGVGGGRGHGGYGGSRGGYERNEDSSKDFSQLTIDQSDSMTKVTSASGHVLALYSAMDAANSKSTNETNASAPAAQWQDKQLVVVTQSDRGGKTTRTYQLSPDGKALYVSTRIDHPRLSEPVTYRFVYDLASASGSSY
jgi:hypothetical protein